MKIQKHFENHILKAFSLFVSKSLKTLETCRKYLYKPLKLRLKGAFKMR